MASDTDNDPRLAATLPLEQRPAAPLGIDDTEAAHPFAARGPTRLTLERGATLGRYVVLDKLGEGGMGVVYKAYDPELDRKLAVKLLRAGPFGGTGDSEGRARLLREGQAMARLSHPNVIAVHDVGTYQGEVFIAMELVDGGTLRAWLEPRRSWSQAVAMFIQAGRGLAAAHEAGIVHRDFKGDNVLVGTDGRARVVDFGLAHAATGAPVGTEAAASSRRGSRKVTSLETPLTQDGALLGTPRYMAPEQLSGERTDATADQFSFCVALYETLYGEPPFEGEDLLTLSSNVLSGKMRPLPPARGVPGWLRPIVARGLSRKATDRYPSMTALIEALERDPMIARRRWLTVGGAVAAVALVSAGLLELRTHRPILCPSAQPEVASVWGDAQKSEIGAAFRATQKPYADDAVSGVERVLDAYASAWVTMRDDACAATRVRGSQSGELMDLRMSCLGDRLAGLRALASQLTHANATTVERAVSAAAALEPLSGCADATALRAPGLPADPEARKRIDDVRAQIASVQVVAHASKPSEALPGAEAALATAKALGYRPLVAEALEAKGMVLDLAGDTKGAIPIFDEALYAAEAGRHESLQTQLWIDLVRADARDQRNPEAHVAAGHAHSLLERDGPGHQLREATLLVSEALLAYNEDHHREAVEKGKLALAIREQFLPPDHPDVAECLNQLGNVAIEEEDFPAALDFHQRALAIRERAFGPSHPLVASSLNNIGNVLSAEGKTDEGIAAYQRSLAIKVAAFGEDSLSVANTLGVVGLNFTLQGKNREAIDVMQRALGIRLRLQGPDHMEVAKVYGFLAEPQIALKRWDEAIANARKAVEIEERAQGPDAPVLASPLTVLGEALVGKGDATAATPVLERALRLGQAREGSHGKVGGTKEALALALTATHGDPLRIRKLADDARAAYAALGPAAQTDLVRVDKEFPPR